LEPLIETACSSETETPCVVQPLQPQLVGYVVEKSRTALAVMHPRAGEGEPDADAAKAWTRSEAASSDAARS